MRATHVPNVIPRDVNVSVVNVVFVIVAIINESQSYFRFRKNWDRQTNRQTDRHTHGSFYRVAP